MLAEFRRQATPVRARQSHGRLRSKNRNARAFRAHNNGATMSFNRGRPMNTATEMTAPAPLPARSATRWAAIAARDPLADGTFFYSVKSTGVYCRPSCAARPARRENIAFHDSAAAAERAGFRPCKRCRPDRPLSAEVLRFAIGASSLGLVLVARTEAGVCAVLLGDSAEQLTRDLQRRFPRARLLHGDGEPLVARVVRLVEDPRPAHDLPLDLRGTAFQRRVWRALARIPAGRTASYADVARRIGAPAAARAVAQACGANALAVVIPCHRVVRADGALSGYRWGAQRKRALLEREARR